MDVTSDPDFGPSHAVQEAMLWASANASALLLGYSFAPDCAEHVRAFIRQGLASLAAQGLSADPGSLLKARANLSILVSRMVVEAQQLGFKELHEPTFFAAKAALCPLWPFC